MHDLKNIRTALGLTQRAFARMIGVSHSQVAMYENGRRPMPDHALEKAYELANNIGKEEMEQEPYFIEAQRKEAEAIRKRLMRKLEKLEAKRQVLDAAFSYMKYVWTEQKKGLTSIFDERKKILPLLESGELEKAFQMPRGPEQTKLFAIMATGGLYEPLHQAMKKYNCNDENQQTLLEMDIEIVEAEMAAINRALGKII